MSKEPDPIYMEVFSLDFRPSFYRVSREQKENLLMEINQTLSAFRDGEVSLKLYRSIRYDASFIVWLCTHSADRIGDLASALKTSSKGFVKIVMGLFSIYDESPYLKKGVSLDDTVKEASGKYIVAYPMSKSNDWYQLPYEERKSIMAEHIGTALSHPDNKGIRSYTTYSFGISDSEFVVIYEVENLVSWSRVTQKLREVKARKWITSETPVLVGYRIDRIEFPGGGH